MNRIKRITSGVLPLALCLGKRLYGSAVPAWRGDFFRFQRGAESFRSISPTFAEPAIHRLGGELRHEFTQNACKKNDGDEENWNPPHRLAPPKEDMKKPEDDKPVRKINLITTMA